MRLLLSIVPIILIAGCVDGMIAEKGDRVFVDYTGTLDNGTVFDSSVDRKPLEFDVGAGQMIKGFDDAVVGMKAGETKTVKIKAEDAYGAVKQGLVQIVPKDRVPDGTKAGDTLVANGQPVKVVSVAGNNVTIDFNHPLAGKDLTFRITMVKIEK